MSEQREGWTASGESRCPRCEGYEATYHTFEGECSQRLEDPWVGAAQDAQCSGGPLGQRETETQGSARPVKAARELLARRVYRMGVQTIEREGGRYFLTIRNRTYRSEVEVPIETARRYWRHMSRLSERAL